MVRDKLGVLFEQPYKKGVVAHRKVLMERLDSLLSREERYWTQHSMTTWLKEGDHIRNGSMRKLRIGNEKIVSRGSEIRLKCGMVHLRV